jgi:hypothetical protein
MMIRLPPDTYKIKAPENFDIYNVEDRKLTLAFFKNIEFIPDKKGYYIELNFSEVKVMKAAAVALLFSIVTARQFYICDDFFSFILPKCKKQRTLFRDSGLFKALKIGQKTTFKSLWKSGSSFICGQTDDKTRDAFLDYLEKKFLPEEFPVKLRTAIKETLLNINHHAFALDKFLNPSDYVDLTWWCYFYKGKDDNGRFLLAIIVDRGMGIASNLRRVFPDMIEKKDVECIEYAMKKHISSTKIEGRGRGSENMKAPIDSIQNDLFLILSNSGLYQYKGKHNITMDELDTPNPFQGTLVEWKLYF